MAVLHLVCGLPGSGKSTFAERLADQTQALWLSPDEWMSRIVGDGYDEARREQVERMQWELAERLLALGVSVVLDNGFWSRDERERLRARAEGLGAEVRLHFLDVPLDELKRRVAARNRNLPKHGFPVAAEDLERWGALFEAPSEEELRRPQA
jgi:predicted kinase